MPDRSHDERDAPASPMPSLEDVIVLRHPDTGHEYTRAAIDAFFDRLRLMTKIDQGDPNPFPRFHLFRRPR